MFAFIIIAIILLYIIIVCLTVHSRKLQETQVGSAFICYDQRKEIARKIEAVYLFYLSA